MCVATVSRRRRNHAAYHDLSKGAVTFWVHRASSRDMKAATRVSDVVHASRHCSNELALTRSSRSKMRAVVDMEGRRTKSEGRRREALSCAGDITDYNLPNPVVEQ